MATNRFKASKYSTCPINRSNCHGLIYEFSLTKFLNLIFTIQAPTACDYKTPCNFIPQQPLKSILKSIKGVLKPVSSKYNK